MRIVRYCACGDHMTCDIYPDSYGQKINELWDSVHHGDGHGDVDWEQCMAAYRKQEQTHGKS